MELLDDHDGYWTTCLKLEVSIFVGWLELKERGLIDWKYRESYCCARILLRPVGSYYFADAKLALSNSDRKLAPKYTRLLQTTKAEPSG